MLDIQARVCSMSPGLMVQAPAGKAGKGDATMITALSIVGVVKPPSPDGVSTTLSPTMAGLVFVR